MPELTSGKGRTAGGVGIDILPSVRASEGDFIGCDPDDVSVLLMESSDVGVQFSGPEGNYVAESCGGPKLGAFEGGKWVEVEVVNDSRRNILEIAISTSSQGLVGDCTNMHTRKVPSSLTEKS